MADAIVYTGGPPLGPASTPASSEATGAENRAESTPAVINRDAGAHWKRTDSAAGEKTTSNVTLLDRCKAGDEQAWQALFCERAGQVYRWAVLLGLTPADAEDAAQEVLAIAARKIRSCEAQEAMTSWLYQITRRVVANVRRLSWWRRWLPTGSQVDLPRQALTAPYDSHGQQADFEIDVRHCLARLPPAQSEVLVLIDIEGFTREEVSRMLSLRPGTVASRLRLARQAMRAQMDPVVDTSNSGLSWGKP